MKIRNEKVINKLKRNKEDKINQAIQLREEIQELNQAFELDSSISSYLGKMINKAASIIGLVFVLNFAAIYFFDVGIDITDYEYIFFLFSLLAISIVGEIIYSLQLRKVMSSSLSLDEKLDAVTNRKLFKGWAFLLVILGILISLGGALYNFIFLLDDYYSFDDGYFFNVILYVIMFVTLYAYIKEGILFPAIIIVVLAGLIMTSNSYLIDYIQQSHRPHTISEMSDTQKEFIFGPDYKQCEANNTCYSESD